MNIIPLHAQRNLQTHFADEGLNPNVKVYFSHQCSCVARNNNNYDPDCTICNFGNVYEKVPEEAIMNLLGMKINRTINESMYQFYSGGVQATIFKYGYDLTKPFRVYNEFKQFDVIVCPSKPRVNSAFCWVDKKDVVVAYDIREILKVHSTEKIEAADVFIEYKQGVDYDIEIGEAISNITWKSDKKPSSSYTVEYISASNYMIWEQSPKIRGGANSEDPKVVYCILRPPFDPRQSPYLKINTDGAKPYEELT